MNDKQRVRDTKQQHNYLSAIAASAYSRRLATNEIINTAYDWVYAQRKNHSHNNSIWSLRANWAQLKPQLISQLLSGSYRLSPLKSHTINGERVSSWEAMDALVLKALALTLSPLFSPEEYSHCTHLKGGGGIHGAVKEVSRQRPGYKYILKSDVYHYYESIDHNVLLQALAKEVNCSIILDLVTQYCQRLEVHDGLYYHFTRGIPKGCPISPLMAALYLKPLDEEMKRHRFYVRFMDDWVVMVKTRHHLRRLIKKTHQLLERLKLKMHPDKTFFGCIAKGFDFLGVHFSDTPRISNTSLENHRARLARRYAQNASPACIGRYIERWTSWCSSLLRCCRKEPFNFILAGMMPNNLTGFLDGLKENENEDIFFTKNIDDYTICI